MSYCLNSFIPKGLWLQWIVSSIVGTMMFVHGLSAGWASPYLAKFTSGESEITATSDEINWMVLIQQLGRIPGSMLGAICVHYFGVKKSLIVNGCAMLINWLLIILADSVTWIFVARFICGVSVQITSVGAPLYIGDISNSNIRGALVTLAANGPMIGILIGSAIGPYISMKAYSFVAMGPTVFFLLTFLWTPDSPYYLMSKKRTEDAEKSILMYKPNADLHVELNSIRDFLSMKTSTTLMDRLREFNIPVNRKFGIIIIVLCIFGSFSGVNVISPYMESIIIRGHVTVIKPSIVPVVANGIGLLSGWTLMYFAEKFGRRTMWVVSSAGLCASLAALGTYFYFVNHGIGSTLLQWIPVVSIIIFKMFFNLGVNCVNVILVSEIFASNIRILASWVLAVSSAIFAFVSVYVDQTLLNTIDEAYVYWIHAILMLISVVFGCLLIPEMKGKTLLEIQNHLKSDLP